MENVHIDHERSSVMVRYLSMEALEYTILDCQRAIEAMPDGHKVGYYQDEINYCVAEKHRRYISGETDKNYKKVISIVEMLIGLVKEKSPESLGTSGSEIIMAEVKQALKNIKGGTR
jgi:hypothetical protein